MVVGKYKFKFIARHTGDKIIHADKVNVVGETIVFIIDEEIIQIEPVGNLESLIRLD